VEWDWNFAVEIVPRWASGVGVTIQATLLGAILAMILGLAFAILRRSPNRILRRSVSAFSEFVRRTPLLLQLYFLFYILPDVGILLTPLMAGIIGLGVHYASYTSEVYRAGIENVARGQWEAAKACNLTSGQTWRHVVLPQAIPPMIPPLANYLIAMFKETPLLAAITVLELMTQAKIVASFNYRYLEPITLVGVFFVIVTIPAVLGTRWLEGRFARAE
jgi:polar amino acid transport system permease protein